MNKPYTTQIIITDTETGKVISEVVVDAIGQIDIHGRSQPALHSPP